MATAVMRTPYAVRSAVITGVTLSKKPAKPNSQRTSSGKDFCKEAFSKEELDAAVEASKEMIKQLQEGKKDSTNKVMIF